MSPSEIEALIRKVVQEELKKLSAPVAAPTPPPVQLPLAPDVIRRVPAWVNYDFAPRVVSEYDQRALRHFMRTAHSYLSVPDITHNGFTSEPVDVNKYLCDVSWKPPRGSPETSMPVGSAELLAKCFAHGSRLSLRPRASRWKHLELCQGLVGDSLPILKQDVTLEWTYIPRGYIKPLRASLEVATRPLDGLARPPLPRWFEPVHPYSLIVPYKDDWVFLFGPRSPAFGRET
jgi:hypothetical protein